MALAQKLGMAIIGVALATTLVLPDRKTPDVLNAGRQFATGVLGTAMGTAKG